MYLLNKYEEKNVSFHNICIFDISTYPAGVFSWCIRTQHIISDSVIGIAALTIRVIDGIDFYFL